MCEILLGPNMTHFDALLQQVNIASGGKSVQATVVDKCNNCGAQDIGACQTIGNWGSFHPLDILFRHVHRCVPTAYWPDWGYGQRRLEFPLEVMGGWLLSVTDSPFSNICGGGEPQSFPWRCV